MPGKSEKREMDLELLESNYGIEIIERIKGV